MKGLDDKKKRVHHRPPNSAKPGGRDAEEAQDWLEGLDTEEEAQWLSTAKKTRRLNLMFAVMIPLCSVLLVFSLWQLFAIQKEYDDAREEYDMLAGVAFPQGSTPQGAGEPLPEPESEPEAEPAMTLEEVMARNADCIAWIEIPGTQLSYPLVLGQNNDKYLNTTFLGNRNSAGAIFMDYRNSTDLSSQHMVVYGHNMKNGTMFGGLAKYLDQSYLANNSAIILRTQTHIYTFRIFAAFQTDMYSPAYQIDFSGPEQFAEFANSYGAPGGTSQILTLSTCTNGADDERILVMAAPETVVAV